LLGVERKAGRWIVMSGRGKVAVGGVAGNIARTGGIEGVALVFWREVAVMGGGSDVIVVERIKGCRGRRRGWFFGRMKESDDGGKEEINFGPCQPIGRIG
jgi:hypothetical protein